jgi:hypothetical protein
LIPKVDYSTVSGDGVILPPLELILIDDGDSFRTAISGLHVSELYWRQFNAEQLPDIVIGDVDFEKDKSSPMQTWNSGYQHISTGLSHLKPFLSIQRILGRPMSLVIHTGDDNLWARIVDDSGDEEAKALRILGLHAAHEIIEIAAIMGQVIHRDDQYDLDPVWKWLKDHVSATPSSVIPEALTRYRQSIVTRFNLARSGDSLGAIRVPSHASIQLRNWCQEMARNPIPLGSHEADIGIPLLYSDGEIDRISIASLFGDVAGILTKKLPSICFDLTPSDSDVWRLLPHGMPNIGGMIASICPLDELINRASKALQQLPIEAEVLTSSLLTIESDKLTRGMAILFRVLEIYQADEEYWDYMWEQGSWDPTTLREGSHDVGWARSLELWVDMIQQALVLASTVEGGDGFVDLSLIKDSLINLTKKELNEDLSMRLTVAQVAVHLCFAIEMGYVESRKTPAGDEYRPLQTPITGAGLRPKRPLKMTHIAWKSTDLKKMLEDTMGFGQKGPGRVNPHQIARTLSSAFFDKQNEKSGDSFLSAFRMGEAPGWVIEVCKEYCQTVLAWSDSRTWPKCINQFGVE